MHLLLAFCLFAQGIATACPTSGGHGGAGKPTAAVVAEPPPNCHGEVARADDATRGFAGQGSGSGNCCESSQCRCGMLHPAAIPLLAQAPAHSAPCATQPGRIARAGASIAQAPDTPPPIA